MTKKLLILFISLPSYAFSQASDFGNWLIYFGDKKIDTKLNWHHEVQYRNFNFLGDTEQLLLRTGLGYNLTENNNNLLFGYAFVYSEFYLPNSEDKINFNEHRLYQQFINRQHFGRVSIQHRYRFEQRFFQDDFRLRLRYFLGLNITLNKQKMQDKTLYLSMYNEVFLNTEHSIFDRNRLYGALGYRFNPKCRIEVGVMNQALTNVARNQINLISFINF